MSALKECYQLIEHQFKAGSGSVLTVRVAAAAGAGELITMVLHQTSNTSAIEPAVRMRGARYLSNLLTT